MADKIIDLWYTLSCLLGFVPDSSLMVLCIYGRTGSGMQVLSALHPAPAVGAAMSVAPCIGQGKVATYGNAIQALSSQGVAETTDTKAFEELLSRHPFHPPPSVSIDLKPALVVDESAVLSCLKAFPKGTSPGWSRLRAQHLLDAIVGTTAPSSHDCLAALTKFMIFFAVR